MDHLRHAATVDVVDAPQRYAVLLNARARGWTGEVHEAVQRFVPSRDLFLTDDFRQAETTVKKCLERDYDVIFTGGGDGTIVYLINAIESAIEQGLIDRADAPPVGVLRLGTGNAIATYVDADPIVEDLQRIHAGAPLKIHHINLIDDGQDRFPFAGFGWDAHILNDYDRFKDKARGTVLEKPATGAAGYAMSVSSMTIPAALLRGDRIVTFINRGPTALELDEHGQVIDQRGPGDILYRGRVKITSPATIPFWGFGIRMFPYCNLRPGFFELRWYKGSIPRVLRDLPGFWRGRVEPTLLGDWLVSQVEVQIDDEPMAYQVAGDAAGYRQGVTWSLAEHGAHLAVPLK